MKPDDLLVVEVEAALASVDVVDEDSFRAALALLAPSDGGEELVDEVEEE